MMGELVKCPCCDGGCVVCYGTGLVKRSNMERARQNDAWPESALLRLYRMITMPQSCAMCGKRTRCASGFCSHACAKEYEVPVE